MCLGGNGAGLSVAAYITPQNSIPSNQF